MHQKVNVPIHQYLNVSSTNSLIPIFELKNPTTKKNQWSFAKEPITKTIQTKNKFEMDQKQDTLQSTPLTTTLLFILMITPK